ncbi:hypothetical protein [Desulfotalea psychrophila]|uniref:Uncharacterized protein n=1 Tax=Desulfotalea psychrophila (strain LSv54 / DSM 12343) TaxID=177439 RepID=Q6ARN4_DESPS|nr:hypothetical protein [Desulfotalea psychrophila]CAG34991.1 unknown protein [Desulfotalea psychrophila LSv54]
MQAGKNCGENLSAIWYQYEVCPGAESLEAQRWKAGLVNMIVFAASDEEGRVLCGRYAARHDWQIIVLKRAGIISTEHLARMEGVFQALYRQAELSGIAARFDGWQLSS